MNRHAAREIALKKNILYVEIPETHKLKLKIFPNKHLFVSFCLFIYFASSLFAFALQK